MGRSQLQTRYLSSLLLLLLLLFVGYGAGAVPVTEVDALLEFRETISEDPLAMLQDWSPSHEDPCSWPGVSCSVPKDHVVGIHLLGASLRGFLPPSIVDITNLQELNLHGNKLYGNIPASVGSLPFLQILDLGMNELSGLIPPELGNLLSIQKMNLQSNQLSGTLPPELGNLKKLMEFQLDWNKLQGSIPGTSSSSTTSLSTGLCQISSVLTVANFSYNYFSGSVPECLTYLPSTSFEGNCLVIEDSNQRNATECERGVDGSVKESSRRHWWILPLEIGTPSLVGLLIIAAIIKRTLLSSGREGFSRHNNEPNGLEMQNI